MQPGIETPSATYSEKLLEELIRISETNKCGLFEAAADYCEEHDLDEAEFLSHLDKNAVDRLKASAIQEGKVRKCIASKPKALA